jgi:hypothetical protein
MIVRGEESLHPACRRCLIQPRRWGDWLEDPQGSAEERAEALSPAGWQQFLNDRLQAAEDEDE